MLPQKSCRSCVDCQIVMTTKMEDSFQLIAAAATSLAGRVTGQSIHCSINLDPGPPRGARGGKKFAFLSANLRC
jgi:hypothetical protein